MLTELRKEGFQPFMVCQTRVRHEDRRDYTKHMLRLRHASQINGAEANEIILLNSHDGTSSYQMLAGMFRFVCQNGLVCGDTFADVRVPHKGNVTDHVIEGAYEVPHGFERVQDSRDAMRVITLDDGEAEVFARSALTLKYDDSGKAPPITETQILRPVVSTTTSPICGRSSTECRRTWSKAAWPAVPPTGASNARAPFKASTRMSGSTGHSGCSRMACVSSKPDPQADRAHRGMVRFSLVSLQQTGHCAADSRCRKPATLEQATPMSVGVADNMPR